MSTTLFFCLQPNKNKLPGKWRVLRALNLALIMTTLSMLTGCGSGSEADGPIIGNIPGSGGGGSIAFGSVSVSLAWDPVPDPSIIGYFLHYGPNSPNSYGSCQYAHSRFSSSPSITVTGLAPNVNYFFTVSAYNGLESACSSEVSTVTSGGWGGTSDGGGKTSGGGGTTSDGGGTTSDGGGKSSDGWGKTKR